MVLSLVSEVDANQKTINEIPVVDGLIACIQAVHIPFHYEGPLTIFLVEALQRYCKIEVFVD